MPPPSAASGTITWPTAGRAAIPPADLPRRAHQRLAERIDLSKARHKPLSILRQEARRIVDQYFEYESPAMPKAEREKVVEEVVGEAYGFGPLEELFRDEAAKEIMVLAFNQVIVKNGDKWLPTSTRFRDAGQYRNYLARLAEVGEHPAGPTGGGAFDVRLPNGYRAVGIVPPAVLDQPPLVTFLRGEIPPPGGSAVVAAEPRAVPARASGVVPMAATRSGVAAVPAAVARSGLTSVSTPISVIRQLAAEAGVGAGAATSRVTPLPQPRPGPEADPFFKVKQRVTERIVTTCAAAGLYDFSRIPTAELQKVVRAHVAEVAASERLSLDEPTAERLVVEILAAMNR